MAKTPVKLKVDGFVDREVASVTYAFEQATDKEGQTTGIPRGGKIVLRVKALNDGNCELLHWMISKALAKSGKIEFMNTAEAGKKMKDVEFKDAYCVDFIEHWEDVHGNDTDLGHYEEITLSCRSIVNQSVTFVNQWT